MRNPEDVAFEVTERYQAFKDAAAIIRADRQEVVEACCEVVCPFCKDSILLISDDFTIYTHEWADGARRYCEAAAIRSALAPKQ